MKPIHLNLASRPYRNYTPVNLAAGTMFVLMLILAWFNFETMLRYNVETKATRAEIAEIEEQTRKEREREQSVQQRLKSIDLARLDAQTKFINAKLAERAFSWSGLLDELESILADDVRLISVTPTFTKDGPIELNMQFEAKTSDGMITTLNRMNDDPQFRNPFPSTESVIEGGGIQFNITSQYLPRANNIDLVEGSR